MQEIQRKNEDKDKFTPLKDAYANYTASQYKKKLAKVNEQLKAAEAELKKAQEPVLDYNKKKK